MVEYRGRAGRVDEDADAASNHQGLGVIHDDAIAADQDDHVRCEGSATLKRTDRGLEMVGSHGNIVPSDAFRCIR